MAAAVLIGLLCAGARAADPPSAPLRIRRIITVRKNVFESGTPLERRFPYTWGNRLHIVTTNAAVRRDLLFREGDVFDEALIRESERLLRSRGRFRYVTITPQPPVNGEVDVVVETEDVWSTSVRLSYGTAGGKHFYRLGFLEHNALGSGRSVGAFVKQDIDRFVKGFSYLDRNAGGRHWELFGGYGSDEKGKEWEARLERPFVSSYTRYSGGVSAVVRDDESRLFDDGDEVTTFREREERVRTTAAARIGPVADDQRRLRLSHEYNRSRFSNFRTNRPAVPPRDRTVIPVLVGIESESRRYIKERGVLTFDRDEDINLGWASTVEAGPSLEAWGATRDGAVARGAVTKAWAWGRGRLFLFDAAAGGRAESERAVNAVLRTRARFLHVRWRGEHTLAVKAEGIFGRRLDPERQFLLGGENGLRAYSVRQFSGNKKMLFNVENRCTVIRDWLQLMSIGWAVFADAGGVWKEHQKPSVGDVKSNLGAGLRLAPSRSVDPSLIRVDVAYALQDNQRRSRWVVNIGADLMFGERNLRKFEE